MLSNLEQAITNVLICKQTPDYFNVLREYTDISRLPKANKEKEAPKFLERAMGKYPASGERAGSPLADHVTSINRDLMQTRLDVLMLCTPFAKRFKCPCMCGESLTRERIIHKLNLVDGEGEPKPVG
ncbi:hypothetical protein JR316_0006662 [Psilocybe cubensis]|uniref:Uncharacterized protein n=2 Tax=Psilocybe cubensis TaxID=181762 RepID=A0A8H8CEW9_PSICU|nr:hypothetical protein JR316_0006662 [Psilocybe cubensis]KAH9480065.1 hypothetical protein JR316_0006662 [Psilocybe cubensis]